MTEEEAKSMGDLFPDLGPEAPVISGIAHDRSEALATVRGVPNEPGMAAKFFQALSDEGINVLMISTSEIRIAALVPLDQLNDAVKALHTAYGLDADQIEAVVYGGTGR